jgi:Holliday junction resolvasome RuvABC ATP-dependent DNA helicase subunit
MWKNILSIEERMFFLNPENSHSPYYGFVGNSQAVKKLIKLDALALGRSDHCCSDVNIAVFGKSGTGKTELIRRHMRANGLTSVEIHPKTIKKVQDVFDAIAFACEKTIIDEIDLKIEKNGSVWEIPPINVFIDEVHDLSDSVVQGLLKATEPKDRMMAIESGDLIDCSNIHWIIATTDRGKLFDALDTRFSKINLVSYSKKEIAKIVSFNYPNWNNDNCDLVASYCPRMPREALSFAKEVAIELELGENNFVKAARKVAIENDIDEWGMSYQRFAVLKNLANGPIAAKNLPTLIGVKYEEMERFVLPWLMEPGEDGPLVVSSPKGYAITEYGITELRKRGLGV